MLECLYIIIQYIELFCIVKYMKFLEVENLR